METAEGSTVDAFLLLLGFFMLIEWDELVCNEWIMKDGECNHSIGSPVHRTPHAVILLTILHDPQLYAAIKHIISIVTQEQSNKRGRRKGGCRWVLWLSDRALVA